MGSTRGGVVGSIVVGVSASVGAIIRHTHYIYRSIHLRSPSIVKYLRAVSYTHLECTWIVPIDAKALRANGGPTK